MNISILITVKHILHIFNCIFAGHVIKLKYGDVGLLALFCKCDHAQADELTGLTHIHNTVFIMAMD